MLLRFFFLAPQAIYTSLIDLTTYLKILGFLQPLFIVNISEIWVIEIIFAGTFNIDFGTLKTFYVGH